MSEKRWTNVISDQLRLDFSMVTELGEFTKFGVNLSGLIDGEWVDLVRYDNSHDDVPHRHICYPDEDDQIHSFIAAVPNTFFAKAQQELTANAEEYLEEYERRKANLARRWSR